MRGLKATFIRLFQAVPTYDKKLNIHQNGINNDYPLLVEERIRNSVTATRCVETMSSYIAGKGFGTDINQIIVNEQKQTTLLRFLQDTTDSIAEQKGIFIQVNYNGNFQHKSYEVLPFNYCRIGKKDDTDYTGKILVSSNWAEVSKNKPVPVDVFNPREEVIQAQVNAAGGWNKYKGQILYINFDRTMYPYAPIHPVLEDADSEKQSAIYKNTSLKKGFFGKTLVITKPMVDPSIETSDPQYYEQNQGREAFKETLASFMGAENNDGIMHLELEFNSDDIEKEIVFKNIETNLDDKLFAHTENAAFSNICVAYGINPDLIRPTSSGLFSQSGEAFYQMKLDYQDQTEDYRLMVEQIMNKLFSNFKTPLTDLKIIPRVKLKETTI